MMDLSKFPLDKQVCSIELASFAKTTRHLLLNWSVDRPIKVYDGLKLPQFSLEQVQTYNCTGSFHIGEYSCLRADILLKRSFGYHLVQSYLPTTLIVVISWLSFWLEVEAIPARITLGVTTLLTISSESTGIRANLPPVSYVKALDVWMGMCTTFVFAALIECTLVNYLSRLKRKGRRRSSNKRQKKRAENPTESIHYLPNGNFSGVQVSLTDEKPQAILHPTAGQPPLWRHVSERNGFVRAHLPLAKKIDQLCRFGFPLCYFVFNAAYWLYYAQ